MPSSQKHNLKSPAAHRPLFACTHCIRRFFNQAGLKNHTQTKHSPITSQPPSSLAYKPPSIVSPGPSNEEEQQPCFLHSPSDKVNTHGMASVHPSSPAQTFYDIPMNDDVIQWSVFTTMTNMSTI